MMKNRLDRPHVERRSVNRVSSAVWPSSIRRVVATGKAAQRRRDWLTQRRWVVLLVDALSMRAIFILTTLLVVISSLLVALLGLSFWYILLVPLLLFILMLLLPAFLASNISVEAPPASLATFAQEFKSSTGLLSLSAQEFKSSTGLLSLATQDLHSGAGYLQDLPHSSGLLSVNGETPATPMPVEPPLVRVLETYDLREVRVRHLFEEMLRGETGEHAAVQRHMPRDFWHAATCPATLNATGSTRPLENRHTNLFKGAEKLPPSDEQA